jgi:hypothetical protein
MGFAHGNGGAPDVEEHKAVMSFICASVINHDITKVMGH